MRLIRIVKTSLRETSGRGVHINFLGIVFNYLLEVGNHDLLRRVCLSLIRSDKSFLRFYLAKSYYQKGQDNKASEYIEAALSFAPNHPDLIYLAVEVYKNLGRRDSAWCLLNRVSTTSRRQKTWVSMCNLVSSKADYNRMCDIYEKSLTAYGNSNKSEYVNKYFIIAALRAQEYSVAKTLALDGINLAKTSKIKVTPSIFKSQFNTKGAAKALSDLGLVLSKANIQMFLVSGTFLGCIREGRILPHDKDLDVGVWSDVSLDRLMGVLRGSGLFFIHEQRSPHVVRIRHCNEIPIDVFYHYHEDGSVWHGGIKAKWYNDNFDLRYYDFLGKRYLAPVNYDKYLTENYGDWRVSEKNFDSAIDTPNAVIASKDEMIVHIVGKLASSDMDIEGTTKYIGILKNLGVSKKYLKRILMDLSNV